MSTTLLDGKKLKDMLIGGAENIRSNVAEINDLNVFPVPDGDTGTNMTKTFEGGISEISALDTDSIGGVMDKFAHGILLGARGNSGVILSQIFAGITEALKKYDTVTAKDLADAYKSGIEKSYKSVMNPTEGTILTVFRESTEFASKNINENSTIDDFFKLHIEEAKRSLARTKEILPVLAEADVVDSGAAGYLCIAMGMYLALTGEIKSAVYRFDSADSAAPRLDINRFTRDSVLEFGYCTEFLLRLMSAKVDPDAFDEKIIIKALEDMGGESIVAFKTEDIVKVHVHTFNPGAVLAKCQEYGEFLTVKIENMSVGHTEEQKKKTAKKFSVLAVATGDGICSLLRDMGADGIISGGQTANPSAEEFIEAFERCEGEYIVVLPNNKNVFLAAKQAAELWDSDRVRIVPTTTLMQGYSALSVITPGITDIDVLVAGAERAAKSVISSEVTCAVRDVTIDGFSVKKGDYIAITDGKITSASATAEEAVMDMLSAVEDMDDYEIITLFTGVGVDSDRRAALTERLEEEYPDHEITVYVGGQEVYDYLIAVE